MNSKDDPEYIGGPCIVVIWTISSLPRVSWVLFSSSSPVGSSLFGGCWPRFLSYCSLDSLPPSIWPASYSDLGVVRSFDGILLHLEGEGCGSPHSSCVAHVGGYVDHADDVGYYQHYQCYQPYLHFGSLWWPFNLAWGLFSAPRWVPMFWPIFKGVWRCPQQIWALYVLLW